MELPLRCQGTLLTGIRGCDLTPKYPLDAPERGLVAFLRFCVMNPADPREVGITGAFFDREPPSAWKASQLGHYPQHWYSHLMHCYEVIAYCYPKGAPDGPRIRAEACRIYFKLVHNLHLRPESEAEMLERLTEDRIANGTVVS